MMTVDEFFDGYAESRQLFDALCKAVYGIGMTELKATKSQIAFRRRKTFAWTWIPGKYLHGKTAPLVLTLSFPSRDPSPRWKEIVEPAPGRFMHHLELFDASDIDQAVVDWWREAWSAAGG